MTVRPCFLLEWYHTCLILTAFDRRARPVLGTILRPPLRTPNPGFTELTTCGLVEMVAFLMPLLQTQPARAYVLTIPLPIQLLFRAYVIDLLLYFRWPLRSKVPTAWLHTSICLVVHTIFPASLRANLLVTLLFFLRSCLSLSRNAKL